jgi:hypothetical protein
MRNILAASLLLGTLMASSAALADRHVQTRPGGFHPPRGGTAVPELNAEAAGAALALVIGGVAVVLGRRRRAKTP